MARAYFLPGSVQWAEVERQDGLWQVSYYVGVTVCWAYGYVYFREAETALIVNGYMKGHVQ